MGDAKRRRQNAPDPATEPRALRWMAGSGPLIVGWCANAIAVGLAVSRGGGPSTETFWLLLAVAVLTGVASLDNARSRPEPGRAPAMVLSALCAIAALLTGALAR